MTQQNQRSSQEMMTNMGKEEKMTVTQTFSTGIVTERKKT
jgi:hypothetical protein